MDDHDADDLAHASTEGFPDSIADSIEDVAARWHSDFTDRMTELAAIAAAQRQRAKWRYLKQRRAIAAGRHPLDAA